jgi:hypothetical protein
MSEERDSYAPDPNVLPDTAPLVRPSLAGVTEPLPTDVVLCSYPDTMDGFAAAWVIYQIAKRDNIPVEFVTGDMFQPEAKEIEGRNWIAISNSLPPVRTVGKGLLTFSRHAEAKAPDPLPYKLWRRTIPFGIDHMSVIGSTSGVHDPKRSLCRIVWEFFCADRVGFEKPPRLIAAIDDFLTNQRYNDTHDIATAISTYPHDFKVYTALAKACDDRKRREAMIAAGQGISRYIDSLKQK